MEATPAPPTFRQVPIVCPGHTRPLTEVQYSPVTADGFFLVSGCHDKLPMLRRGDTGDWVGTFKGHKGAVWSAKLDRDAMLAATGAADFSAKLWDAITGQELQEFAHKHIVKCVDFSPDSANLATSGQEGKLRVFDLESGALTTEIDCAVERVGVNKTVWGGDPNTLITGSARGEVKVWDLRSSSAAVELAVDGLVMDIEFKEVAGAPLLTVASGHSVTLFNGQDFSQLAVHDLSAHDINFENEGGVSVHPSGNKFVAGGQDLWVRVFDRTTGQELECHKGHHGPVRCLRYAPDGATYATGSEDGTIRIWETDPQPPDGDAPGSS